MFVCLFVLFSFVLLFCFDKTQNANFRDNPIFQAIKQHLNNSHTVKTEMKDIYLFWVDLFCYVGYFSERLREQFVEFHFGVIP